MSAIALADYPAAYRSENFHKPPARLQILHQAASDTLLRAAHADTATLWRGDFHQGKQLLAAVKKRIRRHPKAAATPAEAFHKYRLAQSRQSRLANMLLVEIGRGFQIGLARAPDVAAALADVYGCADEEPFLLPLKQLLGFIGAHEWHKKGVELPEIGGRIHVPFGVFSPLRGEYLPLAAQAPLAAGIGSAWDIGTGSGVLAALLARRGVPHITATDTNSRALACARANFERLELAHIVLKAQDLFPEGRADLIVCNPPWLPAKPTSLIETALYDPGHAMLKAFLQGARAHLNTGGTVWLIMSDLAEHLGLRGRNDLPLWIEQAGLRTVGSLNTVPRHRKAADGSDPLAFARSRERTFLYMLQAA